MKTEQLNQTLAQFWGERSQREKMLLGWGGAVLAVAIAYSGRWAPGRWGSGLFAGSPLAVEDGA